MTEGERREWRTARGRGVKNVNFLTAIIKPRQAAPSIIGRTFFHWGSADVQSHVTCKVQLEERHQERDLSRHPEERRALPEPDRHPRAQERRSRRRLQRGALPLSSRQRPDADHRARSDGGKTWDASLKVVLPWTATRAIGIAASASWPTARLLVNLTITGFFKRGVKPEQPSWRAHPMTKEWGDWTWAYKTQAWLGTFVVKSTDGGKTWTQPIPVNVRPLKHGGCRLGCWQLAERLDAHGPLRPHPWL